MVLLEQYCHCKLRTVFLDSEKLLNHDKKALIKRFHTVIDVEGPILDDVLQLRVLNSYGLKKRGCNIQDFFDGLMEDLDRPYTYQIDTNDKAHKVFWPQDFEDKLENIEERYNICRLNPEPSNSSDPSYRNIDEYPQIELKNIISLVLQEKGSLSKDEIIYEVARKMGYERCGALIVATLTKVLEELCENSNCI